MEEKKKGVDKLQRRKLWEMIEDIRKDSKGMRVIVEKEYMEEEESLEWMVEMNEGKIMEKGKKKELMERKDKKNIDEDLIEIMKEEKRRGNREINIKKRENEYDKEIEIEEENVKVRLGDFKEVDNVSFSIKRGEILGFIG